VLVRARSQAILLNRNVEKKKKERTTFACGGERERLHDKYFAHRHQQPK
jgi:hypothetical protein